MTRRQRLRPVKGVTASFVAQTQAMRPLRGAHEQALANIIAVDDAEQALADARKTHDPFKISEAELKLDDARRFGAQTADGLTKAEARAAVKRGELTKASVTAMLKNGELTGSIGTYIAKLLHIPKSVYTTIGLKVEDTQLHTMIDLLKKNHIVLGGGAMRFEVSTGAIPTHKARGGFSPGYAQNITWGEDGLEAIIPLSQRYRADAQKILPKVIDAVGGGAAAGDTYNIKITNHVAANVSNDYDVEKLAEKLSFYQQVRMRAIGVIA